MLRKGTLALVFFCLCLTVNAQRSIQGTVTDATNETLIGVNILIKGTTTGTVTDLNGKYTISVPEGYNTLIFSYTGFGTKEVDLGPSNIVDVTLSDVAIGLDEVVVVGDRVPREIGMVGVCSGGRKRRAGLAEDGL